MELLKLHGIKSLKKSTPLLTKSRFASNGLEIPTLWDSILTMLNYSRTAIRNVKSTYNLKHL